MNAKSIHQYEVLKKLGAGGMGIVYHARDTKLEPDVALKFLPPEWSRDEDAKQRFMLEARTASGLDHQNICTIYEMDGCIRSLDQAVSSGNFNHPGIIKYELMDNARDDPRYLEILVRARVKYEAFKSRFFPDGSF